MAAPFVLMSMRRTREVTGLVSKTPLIEETLVVVVFCSGLVVEV